MNEHQTGQVAGGAAEIYEQFFVPALFAAWPEHLLQAAGLQSGESVLDVACGTGVLARAAAKQVGPIGSVTGIDINAGMLAVAQQKAPHIIWQVGPAEALPFADNSFDCVMSQFGLMFFAEQSKAIAEMTRVLRPGGKMIVAVWDKLENTPGYVAMAELLDELFGPVAAESIQMPYSLGDKEQLSDLFAGTGMANVTVQTVPGQARFASLEDWLYTDIKGWTLADKIDNAGYERLRQYALSKLNRFVQADGTVCFDAPAHIVTAFAGGDDKPTVANQ